MVLYADTHINLKEGGNMTTKTKNSVRIQALVLTMAMLLSVFAILPVNSFAGAENTKTKSVGQILAENYTLSDAEKNLLNSGLLASDSITYSVPEDSDNLISVDEDLKQITAIEYTVGGFEWNPTSAEIWVGDTKEEDVTLTAGVGTYAYDGNAFSVKVNYEVRTTVSAGVQKELLSAGEWLKNGIAKLDALYAQDTNLETLELAIPGLASLKGKEFDLGALGKIDIMNANVEDAITSIETQMTTNGGNVDLRVYSLGYYAAKASALGVKYLLTETSDLKSDLVRDLAALKIIQENINSIDNLSDTAVSSGFISSSEQTAIRALKNVLANLVPAIEALADASGWEASEKGTALVAAGISDLEYGVLAALVEAYNGRTDVAIVEDLLLDTATIQFNMSMSTVTVKVQLKVVEDVNDSDVLVGFGTVGTAQITLKDGATKSEIEAAVSANGIVADTIATWGVYDSEHFVASYSDLPDSLGGDVEYVITYSPKTYNVDYVGSALVLPYGYKLTLEPHGTIGKAYDYYVNTVYCPENTVYVVTGDTEITRNEGKAYTNENLYSIIADEYLNDKAAAILMSGAIKGNKVISVRYPDNVVTLAGNVLTAASYPSSYEGLMWVPSTYSVDGGAAKPFVGNSATIEELSYNGVEVIYELKLTNITNALEIANIPSVIAEEAATQKAALDRLASYSSDMELLKKAIMSTLLSTIEDEEVILNADPAKNDELRTLFKGVVENVVANCYDGSNLKIYNLLTTYNANGLKYYYKNCNEIIANITLLQGYLSQLIGSEDKEDALAVLLGAFGQGDKVDKISKLEGAMADVVASLVPTSEYIDTSASLDSLVAALELGGSCNSFAVLPYELSLKSQPINVSAPDKVSVGVSLFVDGSEKGVVSVNVDKNSSISAGDISNLIALVNAKIAELGLSNDKYTSFYTNDYNVDVLNDLIGQDASAKNLAFSWTIKNYTVYVGGGEQTVNVNNSVITLEAAPEGFRYDYIIDGTKVSQSAETYQFTEDQLKALFTSGSYTVTRELVNLGREKMIATINGLNSAISNNAIVFALTEDASGNLSIVMKIDPSSMDALTGAVPGFATGIVTTDYLYLGINNYAFVSENSQTNAMEISLQAIIDAVMNSGFGSDNLITLMDENGNINNMVMPGNVISDKAMATAGGKLLAGTMEFGNNAADAMSYPLYITLASSQDTLLTVRNLFAGQLYNRVKFVCEEGRFNLDVRVPDKAYQAYLAYLLVSEHVSFANINEIDSEIAWMYINDILEPIMAEDVSIDSYLNTLEKIGFDVNLGENKALLTKAYNAMRGFYNNYKDSFEYVDKSVYVSDVRIQIGKILDTLAGGDPAIQSAIKTIKEYSTGVVVSAGLTVQNIGTRYDAMLIDLKADGLSNKAGFVKNLSSVTIAGPSVIVLLRDVSGDVVLNSTSLLNLNGFTLDGNILGNGDVVVVDFSEEGTGKITGTYSDNVSVMPANDFYKITSNGDEIIIALNAAALATNEIPDVKSLALDVISELIFRGYTFNSLYLDGKQVYDIEINDLLAIYKASNKKDIAIDTVKSIVSVDDLIEIVKSTYRNLKDLSALAEKVHNDEAILEYALTTTPWALTIDHIDADDYLTINIANGSETTKALKVIVEGTEEEKKVVEDLIILVDETVIINDVSYSVVKDIAGKAIDLDISAGLTMTLDFSQTKYAIALSILAADGIGAPNNAELIEGIKTYYATGNLDALRKAFNKVTIAQAIAAIKGFGGVDTFADTVEALGLSDVLDGKVYDLGKATEGLVRIAGAVLRRLPVTGGSTTANAFFNGTDAYVFEKNNVSRSISKSVAGYSVSLGMTVTKAKLTVKMFGADPVSEPEISIPALGSMTDVVKGIRVEDNVLIIDAHFGGITFGQLKNSLNVTATENGVITFSMISSHNANLNDSDYIGTGATLTIKADNDFYQTFAEYDIVILGDTDGDGRLNSNDIVCMRKFWVGTASLNLLQQRAADMNNNGRVDVGDATLMGRKYVSDWDSYESTLNK